MITAKVNLPLPSLPSNLIEELLLIANNEIVDLKYQNGNGIFEIRQIPDHIRDWVKLNITKDISTGVLQTIREGNFEPHIDGPSSKKDIRYYNLLYLIEPGGTNVETCFYQTPINFLKTCIEKKKFRVAYEDAVLVEKFTFNPCTWNLMNTQCIHSVEGISGYRIGLSIGINNQELPNFLLDLINNLTTN
jgi:hypothetical protein